MCKGWSKTEGRRWEQKSWKWEMRLMMEEDRKNVRLSGQCEKLLDAQLVTIFLPQTAAAHQLRPCSELTSDRLNFNTNYSIWLAFLPPPPLLSCRLLLTYLSLVHLGVLWVCTDVEVSFYPLTTSLFSPSFLCLSWGSKSFCLGVCVCPSVWSGA